MHCPISGVHIPKYIATIVVGFAFVFGYEYVLHGILLMPAYDATAELWRPKEQMAEFFPWMLLSQFLFVVLTVKIYALFAKGKCPVRAAFYGLLIGLVLGVNMMGSYAYSPIPLELAMYWLAGLGLEGLGLGLICGLIYKDAGKACCAKKKACHGENEGEGESSS